jgi:putative ABC transport system substrate-binding protein
VLANVPDPFHKTFLDHLLRGGQMLHLEVKPFPVSGTNELAGAFSAMTAAGIEAVVVQPSLRLDAVAELALRHRMPSFAPNQRYPEAGGLMSYSADNTSLYREAATFIDKILKGRKPADLPVQLPTKYRLNVNLKTAAAIGVTVPPTLLVRADEVIE